MKYIGQGIFFCLLLLLSWKNAANVGGNNYERRDVPVLGVSTVSRKENLSSRQPASAWIWISPTPTPKPTQTPVPTSTPVVVALEVPQVEETKVVSNSLMNAVNQWRSERGIAHMIETHELCSLVETRIDELVSLGNLDGHAGFNKYTNASSLSAMGLSGIAENIAMGTDNPNDVVRMWENSDAHREQLLANAQMTQGCAALENKIGVLVGGY